MLNATKACSIAGMASLLLLLAAKSVTMTRAWTITSPSTMAGVGGPCRSILSVRMSSYEEQYEAFAKEQQRQEYIVPRPVPLANQIDDTPDVIYKYADHPIRQNDDESRSFESPAATEDRDGNKISQEELEMAFLEFISCYQTKNTPQMGFMEPPPSQQQQENLEPELYSGISTSLNFGAFPQHTNGDPGDGTRDDGIDTGTTEAAAVASAIVSTESNPPDGTKDDDIGSTEESAREASVFPSTAPTATTTSSLTDENINDDTASKMQSLSTSTSYLENLGSNTTNRDSDSDGNIGDRAVESSANAPDSDSNPEDKYYTVEVRVETTFPTGITMEGARNGWLEFCWAKGGGIVVPAAASSAPPSASKIDSTDADDAPDTIKLESQESKINVEQEPQSSSTSAEVLEIPDGIPSARKLIVPLGLKQELVSSTKIIDDIGTDTIRRDVVTYKTTQSGFFCKDMIDGTHEGKVEFIGASYTTTRMIWTVTFQIEQEEEWSLEHAAETSPGTAGANSMKTATDVMDFALTTKTMMEGYSKQFMDSNPGLKTMMSKANLWGSWSQFQLKTASQNLIAYLDDSVDSIPVMEHTEILPVGVSPREAMETWYDYYWKNGGGSIPVVVSPSKGNDKRWVIPSVLEEELVSLEYDYPVSESGVVGVDGEITTETEIAKAVYKVNNPNLLTYPVYYHRATVRFVRDEETAPTQLFWTVKVKPYRKFLGGGVLFWTKSGISLAAKNLRHYLELRQLKRKDKELQAQLEMLRIKNPNSGVESIAADNDTEKDDKPPLEGFKTIRSTVSISSGQVADSVNDAKAPTGLSISNNNSEDSDDSKRPITLGSAGVAAESTFLPPRTIDTTATIEIDRHTHAVDDGIERDIWP